jgi:hypothetical protein
MSNTNAVESPIINSPIVNNPISGSQISAGDEQEYQDFNACCAAGMPAGNRMFYMKFVLAVFVVAGGGMYGLFKL